MSRLDRFLDDERRQELARRRRASEKNQTNEDREDGWLPIDRTKGSQTLQEDDAKDMDMDIGSDDRGDYLRPRQKALEVIIRRR